MVPLDAVLSGSGGLAPGTSLTYRVTTARFLGPTDYEVRDADGQQIAAVLAIYEPRRWPFIRLLRTMAAALVIGDRLVLRLDSSWALRTILHDGYGRPAGELLPRSLSAARIGRATLLLRWADRDIGVVQRERGGRELSVRTTDGLECARVRRRRSDRRSPRRGDTSVLEFTDRVELLPAALLVAVPLAYDLMLVWTRSTVD